MNLRMLNFGFFLEAMWLWVVQAAEKYPYFPGQEATLRGDVDFLLEVSLTSSSLFVEVAVVCRRFIERKYPAPESSQ